MENIIKEAGHTIYVGNGNRVNHGCEWTEVHGVRLHNSGRFVAIPVSIPGKPAGFPVSYDLMRYYPAVKDQLALDKEHGLHHEDCEAMWGHLGVSDFATLAAEVSNIIAKE